MSTITWLHLSDMHFRESQAYDENIVLKPLLLDLAERIQNDGLQPDLVFLSGDIAFSGRPKEYLMARQFLDDLLGTVGLSKERLFLVPGNHDVDRSLVTTGAKAMGATLTSRNSVNEVLAAPEDRRFVLARFKGYAEFMNDYFEGHLKFDEEHYFYVRTLALSGKQLAVVGLNSAWLCVSDQDKADGLVIGERQARTALEQTGDVDLKIAVVHHPFDWLREFDRNDVESMLLDQCNFVLHGHLHRTAMSQLVSPDSGAMVIAGGACYETRQYPNSYNLIRLDPVMGTGTVYLRRYSDERGGFWAKDVLTYRNTPDGIYRFSIQMPGPRVVKTVPPDGTTGVSQRLKSIQITFDRPMNAQSRSLTSESFQAGDVDFEYNSTTCTFTFTRRSDKPLPPNTRIMFTINPAEPPGLGFVGSDGKRAMTATFGFTTASELASPPRVNGLASGASSPTVSSADEANYNMAAVRELVMNSFSDEEITTMCFDHFPDVYHKFGGGMSKVQKVQALLEQCRTKRKLEDLLLLVQKYNPRQYSYHADRIRKS
jgi:3',5'-cyclic AMP phosphodiesterase CpdA